MQKIYKDASKKTSFPYLPTTWPRGSCFLTQFQYSLVAQVENRGQERAPLAFPGSPSPGEGSGMNRTSPNNGNKWDPVGPMYSTTATFRQGPRSVEALEGALRLASRFSYASYDTHVLTNPGRWTAVEPTAITHEKKGK